MQGSVDCLETIQFIVTALPQKNLQNKAASRSTEDCNQKLEAQCHVRGSAGVTNLTLETCSQALTQSNIQNHPSPPFKERILYFKKFGLTGRHPNLSRVQAALAGQKGPFNEMPKVPPTLFKARGVGSCDGCSTSAGRTQRTLRSTRIPPKFPRCSASTSLRCDHRHPHVIMYSHMYMYVYICAHTNRYTYAYIRCSESLNPN